MDKGSIQQTLRGVYGALNGVEVKGKMNCAVIVACMNDIEKIIKSLDGKEANDGNTHPES